jgi:transcriptional regulator with XRE-family HTH domain
VATTWKKGYMMQTSLAERLRIFRAQRGLTLVEAAERIGIGRDTLSDLERGRRHPVMPTLYKIAQGYGVPVEGLVEDNDEVEPALPKVEAPPEEDPFDDPRASDVRRIKYLRMLSSLALRNVARWESRLEKGGEEENPLEFVGWAVEVLEACTDFAQLVMEHLSFGPFERLPREEAEARQYLNRMIEEMFRISDEVSKQVVVEIEHIRSGRVTTGKKREARETERRFQEIIRSYEEAKEAAPSRR